MKELSIEEKAKLYDKAIERAKYYQKDNGSAVISAIFPELKESEDKKMANIIREALANVTSENTLGKYGLSHPDVSAWLEKQKKEEPSIADIVEEHYWEMLVDEKQGEQKPNKCMYSKDNYTDEDRKVLCDGCEEDCKFKQKQEWSEKDKCMLNNVIDTLKPLSQTTHSGYAINSMIDWLKSLIRPQDRWKPSDEQMYNLAEAAHCDCVFFDMEILKGLYSDLLKLREG